MIAFSALVSSVLACPGSGSPLLHAGAKLTATFTNSCADVAEEIKMRASSMADGTDWTDPHNKGQYSLLKSTGDSYVLIQRTTANNVFTDKSDFTLTATSSGGCKVEGCSESQGISAADNGTNFCDMWSLFCNSQDCEGGNCCKTLKNELDYTVDTQSCTPLPFSCPTNQASYRSTCIKNASDGGEAELELLQNEAILTRMFKN
jgi:hypothetical protein